MKRVIEIVTAIMLLVGLAACQILSNADSQSQEGTQLSVGYLPLVDHFPLMVADGKGLFQEINVKPVRFSDWPSLAEALAAGKIDGAHMLNTLAVKLVSNGFEGKTVLLSHRGSIALVTKSELKDTESLRGKTIAVPSHFSSHYFMLHNFLAANGLVADKDVKILDVAPPDFISMMASGRVDAFIGSEPFPTLAAQKKVGKTFKLWDEMEINGLNGLDCVVVFNDKTIKNQPKAVLEYVRGIIKGGEYIEFDPIESSEVGSDYMLKIDPQFIVRAIDEPKHRSVYSDLYPRSEEYTLLQDYMIRAGALEQGIDMRAFVNAKFADQAYSELGKALPGME